jgi:hypothetical protein
MASVITLPSAPNTGLTALSNVLLDSATQYAGQKRADTIDARRRAERLADIAAEREYSEKTYGRVRGDRLADITDERAYQEKREGAKRDEKLGDVADARYWEEKIRNKGGEEAQQRLNQLTENEAALMARMGERQKRLAAPEPQPTRDQVMTRALAIARQTTGKSTPPTAEIEAAIPQAIEEARTILNQSWQRERLDAQEEQRIDASLLARIGAEKNTITNIFRRVGLASEAPAAAATQAAAPTPPPDLAAIQRGFAEQLRKQLADQGQPGTTGAAPAARPLFNPANDPIIAREQQLRDAEAAQSRLAPLQEVQGQLAAIESRIREAQTTPPQPLVNTMAVSGGFGRPMPTPRGQQAGVLSDLYTQQEALRKRLTSLQDPQIASAPAPAPSSVGAPWWMMPPPQQ